jgi:hypothetical protein
MAQPLYRDVEPEPRRVYDTEDRCQERKLWQQMTDEQLANYWIGEDNEQRISDN